MTTLNISLPESLGEFIKEQVAQGGYRNASEYIECLIRQAQERADQERIEILLLEGIDSGKPIEVTNEWWSEKRLQLIEGFQKPKA